MPLVLVDIVEFGVWNRSLLSVSCLELIFSIFALDLLRFNLKLHTHFYYIMEDNLCTGRNWDCMHDTAAICRSYVGHRGPYSHDIPPQFSIKSTEHITTSFLRRELSEFPRHMSDPAHTNKISQIPIFSSKSVRTNIPASMSKSSSRFATSSTYLTVNSTQRWQTAPTPSIFTHKL